MSDLREQIEELARADACEFVEEFGEPLDSAQTDWDVAAWEEFPDAIKERAQEEGIEDGGWSVYRDALVAEIEYKLTF